LPADGLGNCHRLAIDFRDGPVLQIQYQHRCGNDRKRHQKRKAMMLQIP
jgi:hypothetical protein